MRKRLTRKGILKIAKPILFNNEMVCATRDERKTETRRVVKPQPNANAKLISENLLPETTELGIGAVYAWEDGTVSTPRYKPGDYLYVRESFGIGNLFRDDNGEPNICVCYQREVEEISKTFKISEEEYEKYNDRAADRLEWFPSIHMPKKFSRIFLRVMDVRVEKLQDITEEGTKAEGAIRAYPYIDPQDGKKHFLESRDGTYKCGFSAIWNATASPKERDKYGWNANPWVWVYKFERVYPEEETQR